MEAKKKVVMRFTKKLRLTHCAATHTAQKHFLHIQEESNHFIAVMKDKISGKDPSHIINMDQTLIPYSFHTNKTLELKGSKSIHVHASTTDTKQVTLAVTVDGSSTMLPPMLIFKGATNGQITSHEFITYPDDGHYRCQKRLGWMRE